MAHEHLIYTKEEGIATLTMNRPGELNAFTWDMYQGMVDITKEVASDEDVRVLVLTGTGRAFCVGADVKSLEQGFSTRSTPAVNVGTKAGAETAGDGDSAAAGITRAGVSNLLTVLLQRMDKPVIAAINGITAGGGLDVACACDIRIASEKATFSSIFVRRGILPTMGGTYFLPRLVGIDKACELIWTGDIIDAREAERIGLVTRVVPHEELEAATEELAVKLVKGPPLAISKCKGVIYRGLNIGLESAMEDVVREYAALSQTEDHREALTAFLEKREPVFKGR